ncbi:hypothetical protein FFZ77_16030 [Streptomyces katsurahamanus]|uniref:Uncharacterized protein n=1 Tax=Streptomyces katsurahamanus TaxID=2577098 RepID=A0ABW9NV02_9ACTN|nr:hypothetical protein [Streptomyces katsurahamanus]
MNRVPAGAVTVTGTAPIRGVPVFRISTDEYTQDSPGFLAGVGGRSDTDAFSGGGGGVVGGGVVGGGVVVGGAVTGGCVTGGCVAGGGVG